MRARKLALAVDGTPVAEEGVSPLAIVAVLAAGIAAGEPPPASYGHLSPVEATLFDVGRARFETHEDPASGLGPVFNAESCAICHARPTAGGSSERFVTRFGRLRPDGFDPLTELGGPVVQARGVETPGCTVPGETVPAEATIVAHRDTPPLYGVGLIDSVPDGQILRRADPGDRNGDGVRGHANTVRGRVGRFGWKAQIVSVRQFVATAYLNELGITSPDFPDELLPQGRPTVCDAAHDPEDDGTRIDAVTRFLVLLAPLRPAPGSAAARGGRILFRRIGCEACHTIALRAGRRAPSRALRGRRIRMFSDLLLHDMGPGLADGIAQGFASGSEFRTTPLWGVRASAPYLHDGRTASLEQAIALHGGEAAAARTRFLALSPDRRRALIVFLQRI